MRSRGIPDPHPPIATIDPGESGIDVLVGEGSLISLEEWESHGRLACVGN